MSSITPLYAPPSLRIIGFGAMAIRASTFDPSLGLDPLGRSVVASLRAMLSQAKSL